MIQMGTMLKVADNSGAKKVSCIKVLGGSGRKIARSGDKIVVSVKVDERDARCKRGQVHMAVIVRTKTPVRRRDGSFVRFDDNAVVMIDKQGEPIGSRIFGPVERSVKYRGFLKIISCAKEVL